MERGLLAAVGIVMALFSGLMLTYFIGQATSGTSKNEPGINIGLIVFFGGMLAAGLYLTWRMLRAQTSSLGEARPGVGQAAGDGRQGAHRTAAPPATEAERERRVLRLAEHEHGRVTIPEVAAHCTMTIEESKEELDRLVLLEVAEVQVTEAGVLVYVFPGFLSDQEKSRARDF